MYAGQPGLLIPVRNRSYLNRLGLCPHRIGPWARRLVRTTVFFSFLFLGIFASFVDLSI